MVLPVIFTIAVDIFRYFWTFLSFVSGTPFSKPPCFQGNSLFDRHARVYIYSLALIFYLWEKNHYRNGTFQLDMVKNLRDVAVPGTGVSLKWFSYFKITTLWYLLMVYPLVCLLAAINAWHKRLFFPSNESPYEPFAVVFRQQLLAPQDWFAFWRLNCRLATLHSHVLSGRSKILPVTPEGFDKHGYEIECKWTFLQRCKRLGIAHTPWIDFDAVVCKNRNEEGGLGYMCFKNASAGGDWIIQERLSNSSELDSLLPSKAPLSTFRVITGSWGGLEQVPQSIKEYDSKHPAFAFSAVFRAGLQGALTDHKSILFNIDPNTGIVKRGTTNSHWYRLGLQNMWTCPWTSEHNFSRHPDKKISDSTVEGQTIHRIEEIKALCIEAHEKLCPKVPLSGWDVALTKEHGMILLEANLSCNFFRGDFDLGKYIEFVTAYFANLDESRISNQL
jgi:hypothetical protein